MKGLSGILEQIEQTAQEEAQGLLDEARAQAQTALEAARQEGRRQAGEILSRARGEAQAIRQRAESAALLEKRDRVLQKKQQLIQNCLRAACEALEKAPDEEYFSILLELAARSARPGEGVMHLSAADLRRLPGDFEKRLRDLCGQISLSKTPRQVESGFLLSYGDVDINCTFPALFQEKLDQLRDEAGKILFAPV